MSAAVTKFCTSCQSLRSLEGGYKKPNSMRPWMCKDCYQRKTPSIYASKSGGACDVERLMRQLTDKAA